MSASDQCRYGSNFPRVILYNFFIFLLIYGFGVGVLDLVFGLGF